MPRMLGWCVGLLMRLWASTWRVRVCFASSFTLDGAVPVVFAFWHGQQLALLGARRRAVVALVSWSRDGELQAGAMTALGVGVVRGSSSRGGAAGLRALLRGTCHDRYDLAFAVDGPRGPRGRAKSGAALAALYAGAPLVPLASSAAHRLVLRGAWDRFEIPLPFTRVVVAVGKPLDASRALANPALVDDAIDECRVRAEAEAGPSRGTSSSCPSPR